MNRRNFFGLGAAAIVAPVVAKAAIEQAPPNAYQDTRVPSDAQTQTAWEATPKSTLFTPEQLAAAAKASIDYFMKQGGVL